MKPFTFFNKKYALLVSILLPKNVSLSQTVLGLYKSRAQGCTSWIMDATPVNTNFSYQVNDSSYKWNDSRSILSSIYLNTSAIIKSTEKTSSKDINGFKDATYVIQISNEQLAHFGATYL